MTTANLIEIFCILDEFCKYFAPELKKHTLGVPGKCHRNRPSRMSDSEIITILLLFLRKRSVIETVNDELKNVCQIEHTRHRSVDNFVTNLIAGLIAYNLLLKKPQMNIEILESLDF